MGSRLNHSRVERHRWKMDRSRWSTFSWRTWATVIANELVEEVKVPVKSGYHIGIPESLIRMKPETVRASRSGMTKSERRREEISERSRELRRLRPRASVAGL